MHWRILLYHQAEKYNEVFHDIKYMRKVFHDIKFYEKRKRHKENEKSRHRLEESF